MAINQTDSVDITGIPTRLARPYADWLRAIAAQGPAFKASGRVAELKQLAERADKAARADDAEQFHALRAEYDALVASLDVPKSSLRVDSVSGLTDEQVARVATLSQESAAIDIGSGVPEPVTNSTVVTADDASVQDDLPPGRPEILDQLLTKGMDRATAEAVASTITGSVGQLSDISVTVLRADDQDTVTETEFPAVVADPDQEAVDEDVLMIYMTDSFFRKLHDAGLMSDYLSTYSPESLPRRGSWIITTEAQASLLPAGKYHVVALPPEATADGVVCVVKAIREIVAMGGVRYYGIGDTVRLGAAEQRIIIAAGGTIPAYGSRAANLTAMSVEEVMIRDALAAVEAVGAHPVLTDAVVALTEAQEALARWIDKGNAAERRLSVLMITDTTPCATPPDERATEEEIAAVGADKFPRIKADALNELVESVQYFVVPNTSMTIAVLRTVHGFQTVGYSASASVENFNPMIGRELSLRMAREKLWALEGYCLRKNLAEAQSFRDANPEIAHLIQPRT